MEILTTAEVEGKTLYVDQTFVLSQEDKFVTIKEIFSIDGEIFLATINHQTPFQLTIKKTGQNIQTGRFIFSAKQFVLENGHLFN